MSTSQSVNGRASLQVRVITRQIRVMQIDYVALEAPERGEGMDAILTGNDASGCKIGIRVDSQYNQRHRPQIGGYFVFDGLDRYMSQEEFDVFAHETTEGRWRRLSREEDGYANMVKGLAKPGEEIAAKLRDPASAAHAAESVYDIMTEGRSLDCMKKAVVYGKGSLPVGLGFFPDFTKLTGEQAHMLHMAIGIAGEACELLEAVCASIAGNRDRVNEVEELGDLEFYLEGYRQATDISRDEVLKANFEKLAKRYKGHKYTDEQAIERADKVDDQSENEDWN